MQHLVRPKTNCHSAFIAPMIHLRDLHWSCWELHGKEEKRLTQTNAVIDALSRLSQCWFRARGIVGTNSLLHWFLFLPGSAFLSLTAKSWLRKVSDRLIRSAREMPGFVRIITFVRVNGNRWCKVNIKVIWPLKMAKWMWNGCQYYTGECCHSERERERERERKREREGENERL